MNTTQSDAHMEGADIRLTVEELAYACGTDTSWVVYQVREEILPARQGEPLAWRFGSAELRRARQVASVQRMFDIDSELAAFIADLMDEVRRLRSRSS